MHEGSPRSAQVLATYRKQSRTLMWLGLFFGVAGVGLAALADHRVEVIVKLIGAAVWLAVPASPAPSLRALERIPDAAPVANSGA